MAKKVGYKVKGFKLKEDLITQFETACSNAGASQAVQISKMMKDFINQNN